MARIRGYVAASLLLTAAPAVQALEWGIVLQEESEYTTNTTRSSDDEIEQWVHQPGVQVEVVHEGPAYELDVDYALVREIYQQDVFDDENVATGAADLVWRVLPDRLDFVANHTRTQSTIRAIEVFTPDNREETVNTTAGPILKFAPRGKDTVELQYEWGDRYSEDTENDAITHELSARYGLSLSPIDVFTLEGIKREVQYENPIIPDLEYTIGQLHWDRTARTIIYDIQAGYTKAERGDNLDDVDGFTFDANIEWQASPVDLLTFIAAREIREQPIALTSGDFGDDLLFPVDSDLGEVFVNERASLEWQKQVDGRTSFRISAFYDEEDYEDAARDSERIGFLLNVERQLRPNVLLTLGLSTDERDYDDEREETETTRGDFAVTWSTTPRFDITFGARYEDQKSATTGTGREYDEWVGFLRFSYAVRELPSVVAAGR